MLHGRIAASRPPSEADPQPGTATVPLMGFVPVATGHWLRLTARRPEAYATIAFTTSAFSTPVSFISKP